MTAGELAIAPFVLLPFAWFAITATMLVATLTPTRGRATGLVTLGAAVSYVLNIVAGLAESLSWLRFFSPYHYSDAQRVLTEGAHWPNQVVLLDRHAGLRRARPRGLRAPRDRRRALAPCRAAGPRAGRGGRPGAAGRASVGVSQELRKAACAGRTSGLVTRPDFIVCARDSPGLVPVPALAGGGALWLPARSGTARPSANLLCPRVCS